MESKKKNILIFYPGTHLAYSPTILNLYDSLSEFFNVTICSFSSGFFSNTTIDDRNVIYIKGNKLFSAFLKSFYFINKFLKINKHYYTSNYIDFYFFFIARKYFRSGRYDHIIANDPNSLYALQHSGIDCGIHFLSLEIGSNDRFWPFVNKDKINSIIIQSDKRFKFYFPNDHVTLKKFIIQNSPVFKKITSFDKTESLLYNGTIMGTFGFYYILDFLNQNPEFKLVAKGAINVRDKKIISDNYSNLLQEKRLIIDTEYLSEDEIGNFIANYKIGFCFYDTSVESINTFNYHTAPSGKFFKYLLSGVPVIVNKIEALEEIVGKYKVGMVINDFKPESILDAINRINENYSFYQKNCFDAAKEFDFKKSAEGFVEFLKNV